MKSIFYKTLLLVIVLLTGIGMNDYVLFPGDVDAPVSAREDTSFYKAPDTENHPSEESAISVVSWNIQHLGRTKTDEDIRIMAQILRDFDIVAIQEVVAKDPAGAQAVARLANALSRTGFQWDYQISDPTRSPSPHIRERYAFLWKPSRVNQLRRATLDQHLEDVIDREPFLGTFRKKGKEELFYIINYHSRPYNHRPEEEIIHFFDYPDRLDTDRIIIAGDFNLDEKHMVWEPFYRMGLKNALTDSPTTLKRKCNEGNYLNHAIDNFYFHPGIDIHRAGRLDFVGSCDQLEKARRISDHLPVFMVFSIK